MSFSLIWANLSFTPSKGLITLRIETFKSLLSHCWHCCSVVRCKRMCVCARGVCVCAWCVCVRGGVCVSLWINKTPACFHFMLFQRAEQTACRVNTVLLVPGCEIRQTDSTHMSLPSHECVRACVYVCMCSMCVRMCVCVCVCVCVLSRYCLCLWQSGASHRDFQGSLFPPCSYIVGKHFVSDWQWGVVPPLNV